MLIRWMQTIDEVCELGWRYTNSLLKNASEMAGVDVADL